MVDVLLWSFCFIDFPPPPPRRRTTAVLVDGVLCLNYIINLRRTSSNHELRVAHMDNNISVEIASDSVHGEVNQNLNGPQRSHNINLFTLTWIYFDPSLYSISTQMVVIDLKAQVIITKAFIVSFVVIVVLVFVDLLVAIRFLVGQSIITKIEFVVFMATFSECKTRAGKAV